MKPNCHFQRLSGINIFFIAATYAAAAILALGCSEDAATIRPKVGPMTQSVYASVLVVPEDNYSVYASAPGILDALLVKEGDTVFMGEVIARITSQAPELGKANAELRLELARENLKGKSTILASIKDEIETAEKQAQLDSLNFSRQERLWEQNIGSQSAFENQKLKYEVSQNNLDLLRRKYRQTAIELENSYQQSQNALAQAETNLQDYIVQSRMDGKVYEVIKNEGELISLQEPLAQIGKLDAFVVEMSIDEVDVVLVSKDQKAIISLDAYPSQTFEARITRIFPSKDATNQTFKVEATFTEPPPVLYSGLSGEANIILAQRDGVLSIPTEYLMDGNQVNTTDGVVKVETGMRNLDRVEITAGLDSATAILKP